MKLLNIAVVVLSMDVNNCRSILNITGMLKVHSVILTPKIY